jgi:hypothetical protein
MFLFDMSGVLVLERISRHKAPTAAHRADRLEELHYCQMCLPAHDIVEVSRFLREICIVPPVIGAAFPPGAHPPNVVPGHSARANHSVEPRFLRIK